MQEKQCLVTFDECTLEGLSRVHAVLGGLGRPRQARTACAEKSLLLVATRVCGTHGSTYVQHALLREALVLRELKTSLRYEVRMYYS